jgi:hypothetical protein
MKRTKPNGDLFTRGEVNEKGKVFYKYNLRYKDKSGFYKEEWTTPNSRQIELIGKRLYCKNNAGKLAAHGANRRAIQLERTPRWVKEMYPKEIEEIHQMARELEKIFPWKQHVDHIIPMKNSIICGLHVPWNLHIIPWIDNIRKGNRFDPDAQQPPSVSEGYYKNGTVFTQPWPIPTARSWENDNDLDHHSRTVQRQDIDHSAQESSRNSVGCGSTEVVAFEPFTRIKDYGQPEPEIVRLEFGRRYLFDKP